MSGFSPTPDAEDRLRRALALMIKYVTMGRHAPHGENDPAENPHAEDHAEANA